MLRKPKPKKKSVGRPKLSPEKRRTEPVKMFFTKAHKKLLEDFAAERDLPMSEVIFRCVCKVVPEPQTPNV
jgi:hypothetical protein